MKVIIPAAGVGTRLRPHTHTTPKPLVAVAGKPILGHIMDALMPVGISEVILVVGQWGDRIADYVDRAYPVKVTAVEQAEQRGLGHAVLLAGQAVPGDEPILIVLGDTIFSAELPPVVDAGVSAVGVREVENPSQFGIVEVAGDRIQRLVEKPQDPPGNLAIAGVYFLKSSARLFAALEEVVRRDIKVKGEYQLTDGLQLMLDGGEVMTTFPLTEWWDCGNPETLLQTNRRLLEQLDGEIPEMPGTIIIPPVAIAATARLEACIVGPYASIADEVQVTRSVVRDSILNEGARVDEVVLEHSLIGERAVVKGTPTRVNIGDSSEIHIGHGH